MNSGSKKYGVCWRCKKGKIVFPYAICRKCIDYLESKRKWKKMKEIPQSASEHYFSSIYMDLVFKSKEVVPRGQKSVELENYSFDLPPYIRFTNFEIRKFNVDYVKKEFLWYLKGDKFDTSIGEHASLWKTLVNKDGSINSNYGQYIFGTINQFDKVLEVLSKDKFSRRAVMMILSKDHLFMQTNDIPCTYSISFRIRNNHLNMSVRMRSQDAIFGMSNDIPTFSFIHEMMYVCLRDVYPELEYGMYHHSIDSLHVYERHYDMLNKIVYSPYSVITCPKISSKEEVSFLRNMSLPVAIPKAYEFANWLL